MIAEIIAVNLEKGFYAFESEGHYGWFEMLDSADLEPGDRLKGNFENLGGEVVKRVGDNEKIDVFIQDILSSKACVIQAINT